MSETKGEVKNEEVDSLIRADESLEDFDKKDMEKTYPHINFTGSTNFNMPMAELP